MLVILGIAPIAIAVTLDIWNGARIRKMPNSVNRRNARADGTRDGRGTPYSDMRHTLRTLYVPKFEPKRQSTQCRWSQCPRLRIVCAMQSAAKAQDETRAEPG